VKNAILAFLLCTLTALAADITGDWTGTAQVKRGDGSVGTEPAFLMLKQQGTTVTGTVGENPNRQQRIRNGKVEGDRITFQLPIVAGSHVRVDLKLQPDGNIMKGQVHIEREGFKQTDQLEVKRHNSPK
jgi:hypothetical protein